MSKKYFLAVLMVCVLMVVSVEIPTGAKAAIKEEGGITPFYIYTRAVSAGLNISSSGIATCTGSIRVYSTTSDISMRVNLYKKVGSSWIKEVGWTNSCEGRMSLSISETYTVTEGTYKVVTTAAIIAEDGNYETVSEESDIITYP